MCCECRGSAYIEGEVVLSGDKHGMGIYVATLLISWTD